MNSVYRDKSECYGCSACKSSCPTSAITMEIDKEGFYYPVIDSNVCVDCGVCVKVCPYNCEIQKSVFNQRYYAVQHNSAVIVKNSSSGGFFTAISDKVLEADGVVYGAYFDEAFVVKHGRATQKLERDKFVGSKYMQSDMADIMSNLLKDLQEGRTVLFSGTPCQVAGVSSLVLKKRKTLDRLILCDFICHGASSPVVWDAYVRYLSDKCKDGLTTYHFRGKKQGWHQWYPIIKDSKADVSEEYRNKNSYVLLYQTCYINRESCYSCKYTSYDRVSDITMADFWNVEKVCPEMNDNRGTSEVLVNSEKGQAWFEKCKDSIRYIECDKEDVWQPHLEYPESKPKKRAEFWTDFFSYDFEKVLYKYGKGDFMAKLKNFVVPIAKKIGIYMLLGKVYKVLFVKKGNKDDQ